MSVQSILGKTGSLILILAGGSTAFAQAPAIKASWAGNGLIKVIGTGWSTDEDECELTFDQGGVDSPEESQTFFNFSANPTTGKFGDANDTVGDCSGAVIDNFQPAHIKNCQFPVYITPSCVVGVIGLDLGKPTGQNISNAVNLTVPSSQCPHPKLAGKLIKGSSPSIVVTGSGFTPGGSVSIVVYLDSTSGTPIFGGSATATGTLRPGPYPTNEGKVSITVPAACGHKNVVWSVDDDSDVDPPLLTINPGC